MDADVDEFSPDYEALQARLEGISACLDGPWALKLRAQLHLDHDTAECAYWHAGYVQALADILKVAAKNATTYGSADTANPSHAVC